MQSPRGALGIANAIPGRLTKRYPTMVQIKSCAEGFVNGARDHAERTSTSIGSSCAINGEGIRAVISSTMCRVEPGIEIPTVAARNCA